MLLDAIIVFLNRPFLHSYPSYMPILQRAIELWYHVPACTTPVLKLMAELVHNRYVNMILSSVSNSDDLRFVCSSWFIKFVFCLRSQRLQFDVSSPNGILLFRETSKMITTYGTSSSSVLDFFPSSLQSNSSYRLFNVLSTNKRLV